MRWLILLRHAESALNPAGTDAERALTPAGREQARDVGTYLKAENLLPDLALVSSAQRTQETWEIAAKALGPVETRIERQIYNAPAERLKDLVEGTAGGVRTLILVGHNPGIEELAKTLMGSGDRYSQARLRERFPPGALAVVDFAIEDWAELAVGDGRLDRFVEPAGARPR